MLAAYLSGRTLLLLLDEYLEVGGGLQASIAHGGWSTACQFEKVGSQLCAISKSGVAAVCY